MVSPLSSGGSDRILNSLQQNRVNAQKSLTRIASSQRRAAAGDDPAGAAISARLRSEIRVLSQAAQNAETGGNFIRVAEGGLAAISDLLARGRELSIQAANGTLNPSQRQALAQELDSIKNETDRIAQSAEFNGQKLLDGSLASGSANRVDIQVGSTSGSESQINLNVIDDAGAQALGIDNADISSAESARQTLDVFERAQAKVVSMRGQVGTVANRLDSAATKLGTTVENLIQSDSQLSDANLPEEITSLRQNLVQIQTSIRVLGIQSRQNGQLVGRLLNTQG
ncbi:MAG: flagellin [Nitrospinales bacterium]